jgi:hypothetical protein
MLVVDVNEILADDEAPLDGGLDADGDGEVRLMSAERWRTASRKDCME